MTNRLFIALDIPDPVLEKLIEIKNNLYGKSDNIKWEDKEKLHITVKFLGDVGENITDLLSLIRLNKACLLYTSPSPRDRTRSRMPSSA